MRYNKKFSYELPDKEHKIVGMDTNEEKIIILLSSSQMLAGKIKYELAK